MTGSDGDILGFFDESSTIVRTRAKTWSFFKPLLTVNTTPLKTNIYGFYTLDGNSVISFKKRSRDTEFCEFLDEVKTANPGKRIDFIIDNLPSHKTSYSLRRAKELDINLIFIPPYSPDLNPIEHLWREMKSTISTLFMRTLQEVEKTASGLFKKLAKKKTYALNWMKIYKTNITTLA